MCFKTIFDRFDIIFNFGIKYGQVWPNVRIDNKIKRYFIAISLSSSGNLLVILSANTVRINPSMMSLVEGH